MSTEINTRDLMRYFKKDKFAQFIGIELLDVREGWAKAVLEIKDHHLNGLKSVHGGVIYSLADLAFAAAANSTGRVAVAINNTISYVKAPQGTVIYAEAREVSQNHKLATYAVNVTDAQGEIIAVFQGMVYRKSHKIDYYEKM
jgi:acyl-CoA thioesterase